MEDTTIIKAVFEWFTDCEIIAEGKPVKVDYLGEEAGDYSIEPVPTQTVIKKYVDGSAKCQYLFVFASRENYSEDEDLNIENLEFYERLEEWIAEQNINCRLPKLPKNCTAQSLSILSSGYVANTDTSTARYQIQCRLTYIKTPQEEK